MSEEASFLLPTLQQEMSLYQLLFPCLVVSQAKALYLFEILKCATFARKTFFHHQNTYLLPVVDLVRGHHRKELLDKLRQSCRIPRLTN